MAKYRPKGHEVKPQNIWANLTSSQAVCVLLAKRIGTKLGAVFRWKFFGMNCHGLSKGAETCNKTILHILHLDFFC